MKRASLFALLILLMSVLCAAGPADAQQNPLLGGQEAASPDEPPTAPANGGLLHRLERDVVMAQAYFAHNIDRQLVARERRHMRHL
jgi:hypothetical protein